MQAPGPALLFLLRSWYITASITRCICSLHICAAMHTQHQQSLAAIRRRPTRTNNSGHMLVSTSAAATALALHTVLGILEGGAACSARYAHAATAHREGGRAKRSLDKEVGLLTFVAMCPQKTLHLDTKRVHTRLMIHALERKAHFKDCWPEQHALDTHTLRRTSAAIHAIHHHKTAAVHHHKTAAL